MRTKTDIYHRTQATMTLCYGFAMRVAYKTQRGGPGQAHDRRQYEQYGKVGQARQDRFAEFCEPFLEPLTKPIDKS